MRNSERSSPKESTIEQAVTRHAKKCGWLSIKLQDMNFRGLPDRLYLHDGRVMFVEFKAPGKKPRKSQTLVHRILREHGAEVHVIDNIEAGKQLLSVTENED